MIGVLLPTKGRYEALEKCLNSLADSNMAEEMEVIIVADQDLRSYKIAVDFEEQTKFGYYLVSNERERLYPVKAFNVALDLCSSNIFTWINDECVFEKWWLENLHKVFLRLFPDQIGVLSTGIKRNKAAFGISSKKFVKFNDGEWFHEGYKVHFCDDELACRAVLLGRYKFIKEKESGIHHNQELYENIHLIPPEEKISMRKKDRKLFSERNCRNFEMDHRRFYEWKGFRDINEPLKLNIESLNQNEKTPSLKSGFNETRTVAIVLVNYFRIKLTKFCIDTLVNTLPKKNYRLIVIDNNSPDNSKEILSEYHSKGIIDNLIINNQNLHETFALNQGMSLVKEKYSDMDFFLWQVQDFFFMERWYENALTVMDDLGLDFVSCCFLEGLTNGKVLNSVEQVTENGGRFSDFVLRRKWPYDVGHSPLIKMKYILDSSIKIEAESKIGKSSQIEMYEILQHKLNLKGKRLNKPCILMQDSEFNNPEYNLYYRYIHGKEGDTVMKKWLRKFMRFGHVWNPEEYYRGSGYNVSKYYAAGKDAIVAFGFKEERDLPDHGWR